MSQLQKLIAWMGVTSPQRIRVAIAQRNGSSSHDMGESLLCEFSRALREAGAS